MATIRKRKTRDGSIRWQVQVRRAGFPALSETFPTKDEARRWGTAREREIDHGQLGAVANRHTLSELLEAYQASVDFSDLRPTSQRRRVMELAWWSKRLGSLKLQAITPKVVGEHRDALMQGDTPSGRPASPASVNNYLNGLSAVFQFGLEELGWTETNPVRRVRKPMLPRGRDRFLTDDEFERLMSAASASPCARLRPLLLLALSSGGRRTELLELRWSAVDLERGTASVMVTKNGHPKTLHISGLALAELRAWAALRGTEGRVFEPSPGEKLYPERWFRRAVRAAGIEGFRFHDLRHTAATWLAMLGASGPELAAFLGHRTLTMVSRYTHLARSYRSRVARRMVCRLLEFGSAGSEPALEGVEVEIQAPALLDGGGVQAVGGPSIEPPAQSVAGDAEALGDLLGAGKALEALGAQDEVLEILYATVDFRHPTNKGSDAFGGSEEVIIPAHTEPSNTGE